MAIATINPLTSVLVKEFVAHTGSEVNAILDELVASQRAWAATDLATRSDHLRRLAAAMRARSEELATLAAIEMGKPIRQGRAEVEKCALCCEFYADHAAALLADDPVTTSATYSAVRYRPMGVLLAVMPWNYPFWQVMRFAAPAIVAGNGFALKHASNVPQCALAVETLFEDAGFPAGLVRTLLVPASGVRSIIEDPRIAAVTLTGSEQAGRDVGAAAGGALKKAVLELGGSDPFIVLGDADIDSVARAAAEARTLNSGQSCIAAKRFLVEPSIYEPFLEAFATAMANLAVGDPLDVGTDVGPQARADLRDETHEQVARTIAQGGRAIVGCEVPAGAGAFYPPSIVADVVPGMTAFDEEIFGPVAAVSVIDGDAAIIELANTSPFGLGSSIWTNDADRVARIADGLDVGMVFVNDIVRSDPRVPFGGVKASGYGRELSSFGMREFCNVQTFWKNG